MAVSADIFWFEWTDRSGAPEECRIRKIGTGFVFESIKGQQVTRIFSVDDRAHSTVDRMLLGIAKVIFEETEEKQTRVAENDLEC